MNEELQEEFLRHVKLGQCDIAAAFAQLGKANVNIAKLQLFLDILNYIFSCPRCLISERNNSVSWLCCCVSRNVNGNHVNNTKCLEAEFRLILQYLVGVLPENAPLDIHRAYCNALTTPSSEFNQICKSSLEDLVIALLQHPTKVHYLMKWILESDKSMQVLELYHTALQSIIREIKDSSNYEECNSTRSLVFFSIIPEEVFETDAVNECLKVLSMLSHAGKLKPGKIYSALLGRDTPSLLKLYIKYENICHMGTRDQLMLPKEEEPWNLELLFLLGLKQEHFLKNIIEACVEHILCGRIERSFELLSPEYLSILQPLAILVAWQQQKNHQEALHVLNAIRQWSSEDADPRVIHLMNFLKYNVTVLEWATKQTKAEENFCSYWQSKGVSIFESLQRHSPLFVLHQYLGPDSLLTEQLVLNLKEWNSSLNKNEKEADESEILKGVLILKEVLDAIFCSFELDLVMEGKVSNDQFHPKSLRSQLSKSFEEKEADTTYNTFVASKLACAEQRLKSIEHLDLRVELLENIFSVMFIRTTEFGQLCAQYCESDEGHVGVDLKTLEQLTKTNETPISQRDDGRPSNTGRRPSVSSSSASCDIKYREGFLCSHKIIGSILGILNIALIEAKNTLYRQTFGDNVLADNFNSNNEEIGSFGKRVVQKKISQLSVQVKEAQWRYELLASDIFPSKSTVSEMSPPRPSLERRESRQILRKKRRKRSKSMLHKGLALESAVSIVHRMLASPESLLRNAILQKNYSKARQVIQLFGLLGSHDAQEALFSENLPNLINKLNTAVTSNLSPNSNTLTMAAVVGAETTSDMMALESHFKSFPAPSFEDWEQLKEVAPSSENASSLLMNLENRDSIAAADIAYTAHLFPTKSEVLLSYGLRKMSSLDPANQPIFRFANSMLDFYTEVNKTAKEIGLDEVSPTYPFHRLQLKSIFHCLGPLNANTLTRNADTWHEFFYHLELVNKLLIKEDCQVSIFQGQDQRDLREADVLHSAFTRFGKFLSVSAKSGSLDCFKDTPRTVPNYLIQLSKHVEKVFKVLEKCHHSIHGLDWIKDSTFFAVLRHSPLRILGQLILQKRLPLNELEDFATKMNLDLVLVITKTCLPIIPNCLDVTITKRRSCTKAGHYPEDPELLSQSLLTEVIHLINTNLIETGEQYLTAEGMLKLCAKPEIQSWIESCQSLSMVDLTKLQAEEANLSFFGNVFNILWLQTIFMDISKNFKNAKISEMEDLSELLSPHLAQRIIKQCLSCSKLGQMGNVSLLDLKYGLLYRNTGVPEYLSSQPIGILAGFECNPLQLDYFPAGDPRILFVLCENLTSFSKLQILSSSNVSSQLNDVMVEYLNHYIHVDFDHEIVKLPQLLIWNSHLFFKTENENLLEGVLRFARSHLKGDLNEALHKVISSFEDQDEDLTGSSSPSFLPFQVEIVPFDAKFINYQCLKKPNDQESKLAQQQNYVLPDHLQEYLSIRCSSIMNVVQAVEGTVTSNLDNFQSSDPFSRKLASSYHFRSREDKNVWNKVIPLLSPLPSTELIWQTVDEESNLENCLTALNLIEELSSVAYTSPTLMLLRECLCFHISLLPQCLEISEPWSYALRLKCPKKRCSAVLKGLKNWPAEVCLQALDVCIYSFDVQNLPDQLNILEKRKREILLYKEIQIELYSDSELQERLKSWQAVEEMITNDLATLIHSLSRNPNLAVSCSIFAEFQHTPSEFRKTIAELNAQCLLNSNPPKTEAATKVLKGLETKAAIVEVCISLLTTVEKIPERLFLVNFLLTEDLNLDLELIKKLEQKNIGLQMLSSVFAYERLNYERLVDHPLLMLEQMLMNTEFETALKALLSVSESSMVEPFTVDAINSCVEAYARLALDFVLVDSSSASSDVSSHPTVPDQFIMPSKPPSKSQWVSDNDVTVCMVCGIEKFSMFLRRHHCRRCGRVVSFNCSKHCLMVEGYCNIPVRVCDDCYEQTTHASYFSAVTERHIKLSTSSNDPARRQRSSTVASLETSQWQLFTDENQNTTVRDEFCYEQAPSVPLYLSVLQLHRGPPASCAEFMMKSCHNLFRMIVPQKSGYINREVDYALVISMIRSLLLSAKVKYVEAKDNEGIENCESYSSSLDLVNLLITNNCLHLIPSQDITNKEVIRRISDSLVEEERMNLALEVKTKYGFDVNSVWATWAKLKLKAGDWSGARSKFIHCLKKPKDLTKQKQENPLLLEIIEILESFSNHSSLNKPGGVIFESLSSLKNIKTGVTKMNRIQEINLDIYEECMYYLNHYGSHVTIVKFYQKCGMITKALDYIVNQGCDPDTFFNGLFQPCIQAGRLGLLFEQLKLQDQTLSKCWKHLFATCRSLQQQSLFHVLYKLQVFMEDYFRAGITSIHFFRSPARNYEELFERLHHLHSAKNNFAQCLKRNISYKHVVKKPASAIQGHIETILLQITITVFMHNCKKNNLLENFNLLEIEKSMETEEEIVTRSCPPTCFDSHNRKAALAVMAMLYGTVDELGLTLGTSIILQQKIDCNIVSQVLGRELAKMPKVAVTTEMVVNFCKNSDISGQISTDLIVNSCIQELSKKTGQGRELENLVKLLESNDSKIKAFIACRKLKSAYLLAIRLERVDDVRTIAEMARKENQDSMASICEKWLLHKKKN